MENGQNGDLTPCLLIVEDDSGLRSLVSRAFQNHDYRVQVFDEVQASLRFLASNTVDLLLLDIELPDGTGFEILEFMRKRNPLVPILIMSTFTATDVRIKSFSLGSDDFVRKPFDIDELVVRVDRALQRSRILPASPGCDAEQIRIGVCRLDRKKRILHINGKMHSLRRKIFNLLEFLMKHPDIVLTKEVLHKEIWGVEEFYEDNSLSVHIYQVRKIFEKSGYKGALETVYGVGYILNSNVLEEE